MFPSKTLFSLIFIALSVVDASPLNRRSGKATLSLATSINRRGTFNIVENDRARAQSMKQTANSSKRGVASLPIMNDGVDYTAEVGIGNPPTYYKLLIDTGSSNTWVGANQAYQPTSQSGDTGNTVSVSYGSGQFSGEEWMDTVTLSSELVIDQQSIGVANSSSGISNGIDGILGVGPVDLTTGTVSNTNTVPTVTQNLHAQGTIPQEVLGVYFVPASNVVSDGMLTFGGYDSSAVTGPVNYAPLTSTSPACNFWGIDQSITYGGTTILSLTAGIVDTGTTLILIATDAFQQYQQLTGATLDSTTSLLKIDSTQYNNLQTLTFTTGGASYDLTPNAQIWPRSLNTNIGGTADSIYLVINDIGTPAGSGLDFINGYSFLERYYSIYDTGNAQVGFAATAYTTSETN